MSHNSVLTSDEACSIIKACAESRVATIRFRGLYLQFEPKAPLVVPTPGLPIEADRPEAAIQDEVQEKVTKETLVHEEQAMREDQMDLMMIENPLLLEQLIQNGEVELNDDVTEDGLEET